MQLEINWRKQTTQMPTLFDVDDQDKFQFDNMLGEGNDAKIDK